jgi:hypothetical protein
LLLTEQEGINMTAEIVIMNKNAVALAADSAVTIEHITASGKVQKIFNTVNKLFALSKYHQVGIMVFGNSEIIGIPWEVVIKIYRETLKDKASPTIKSYALDFINFLGSFFTDKLQSDNLISFVASFYHVLVKFEIDKKIEIHFSENEKITDDDIKRIVASCIQDAYKIVSQWGRLDYLSDDFEQQIVSRYKSDIQKSIKLVFEELPIAQENFEILEKLAALAFTTANFPTSFSGIVVAGYGEDEKFPSIFSFSVNGVINDQLLYKVEHNDSVSETNNASIFPFAQSEMVNTFVEGIAPDYESLIWGYLDRIFSEYPQAVVDNLHVDNAEKDNLTQTLLEHSKGIVENLRQNLLKYKQEYYIDPIVNAVSFLPKEELAEMAESLVNLTSFKRKMSLDAETVGGPIDVVIISKGDGFIWIKRKHYFKPELNHHFFTNYYKKIMILGD